MIYFSYPFILQGEDATEENARLVAQDGAILSECEPEAQGIEYGRYIDTVFGTDIYYDYGADYYFFCPTTIED